MSKVSSKIYSKLSTSLFCNALWKNKIYEMSTLSKKKLAKKDLFKIKIRYNKDIKRKGI